MNESVRPGAVWCEQAWLGGSDGVKTGVRAELDGNGVVARVTTGAEPREGDLTLHGVAFPAAANAHSHAFHRVLRGRTHASGVGTFWTWRREMYRAANALTPALYEELATAVYTEMVVTGWTSVAEFHYVHHRPDGSPYTADDDGAHAMEHALARAAVTAGIRLTLLDTCYLAGGFDEPTSPEQGRFSDGGAGAWLDRFTSLRKSIAGEFDPSLVSVGAALHSVRAVPEEELSLIAERLPRDVPLHIHLSEQKPENAACLARTGLTPTGLLHKHGLVTDRLSAVHATHLTDEDIRTLGSAGATVVMCPTTEADLADGIGPASALRGAGAQIALGTDQHAVVDPWQEMRALEYGERFASGERGRFAPANLHFSASDAGSRSQARQFPGLEPGRVCDLMVLNPRSTRTAGSEPGQLAMTATAQDVTAVVVGGRIIARGGVHTVLGDPADLLAAAIAKVGQAAKGAA
ncbi:formimidoylglutamate deiminase [Arthrobacter sp. H5]|uniref:formimidoylglutamate deiminase n=1 Tax=Arthrobacter sp. H5 TaxID=1267973 RepID=UPI0004B62A47|nr:formimidoylglutamate deiminase [Arthrobacter sp. H5]